MKLRTALSIAGSDCSGGAGIQADLKTFSANGVFGMSVVTSVVAENTSRVISIENISTGVIADQIDAVFEDIEVNAVKIGMLSDTDRIGVVAQKLQQYRPPFVVVDPVMIAKGGHALMESSALSMLIARIIPLSTVLTPNIPEAEAITGMTIHNREQMQQAARRIISMGARNVIIKGGHLSEDEEAEDILYDGRAFRSFVTRRIPTKNTHGTGCTFSSAITAGLAKGLTVEQAVEAAKAYVQTAIEHALEIGKGHGPTNHFYELYKKGNLL